MEEIKMYKASLFWIIVGFVILVISGLWFGLGAKDEGILFNQGDLIDKATAPVVLDKTTTAGDEKLVKKLEAPIVKNSDALSGAEEEMLVRGTTAPIPGVK